MLLAIEQAVQHCRREAFSVPLALDQQAMQHCGFETVWVEWISARRAFHCSRQLKVEGRLSACVFLELRNGHLLGVRRL